jgi:hypothetical protein
MTWNYKDKKVT